MIVPLKNFFQLSIILTLSKKTKEDFYEKLFDKTTSASKNKITDVFIEPFPIPNRIYSVCGRSIC